DITVVAWQLMRNNVEKMIPQLEEKGVSVELIDPRTIRPFDYETLYESVRKTGRLLIVHEHTKIGGVGESIAANVQKDLWDELKSPIEVLGQAELPIPMGPEERYLYPTNEEIAIGQERWDYVEKLIHMTIDSMKLLRNTMYRGFMKT